MERWLCIARERREIIGGDGGILQRLDLDIKPRDGEPPLSLDQAKTAVEVVKALLHLTAQTELKIVEPKLALQFGEAISLIKPGDWPNLKVLDLTCIEDNDDSFGAMQGLLGLSAVQDLFIF